MALFRKFFFKKPPEGLLEVSERIFGMHFLFVSFRSVGFHWSFNSSLYQGGQVYRFGILEY